MAGDWIKWTKGLAFRREVLIIASRLDRDNFSIAGRLMHLWEWCDSNFSETDVDEMSLDVSLKIGDKPFEFVDALCGLPGLAETLASPDVRWIEARSGGRIVFPNLARHNGTSAKVRASEADKKRRQRKDKSPKGTPKAICPPKCPDDNGTKSGPEKRREELNTPKPPEGGEKEVFEPPKIPPKLRAKYSDDVARFAEEFRFAQRGRGELLEEIADRVQGAVDGGTSLDVLRAAFAVKPRDTGERVFHLIDRAKKPGKPSVPSVEPGEHKKKILENMKRVQEEMKNAGIAPSAKSERSKAVG